MIDSLSFINNHWFWYVVIFAILLWLVFAWKEWQQPNKSKLYLKLVLASVALTSLAFIVLKPLVVSQLDTYKMVVLTKGYDVNKLDSIKNSNKKIQVLNYEVNESFINPNKKPSTIYILGEGIAPFDFYQLDSLNVSYLGNPKASGIVQLKFDQEQVVGNTINIEGLYANAKKGRKIILESPANTGLDSIVFSTDSTQPFKLSTQLNVIGNYEYHLIEKDSLNNLINSNPIGIRVVPESDLSILIINGFPTFETKYLKNYLAEKGHQLTVRSQVTRGKFKYEYFNLNTKTAVDFSEKTLQNFDLVIIDAQSFRNLGRNQKSSLEKAVRNDGLGVFIQSNTVFNGIVNYLTDFNVQADNITKINMEAWPKIGFTKSPLHLKPNFTLQSIFEVNNQILTASKTLGQGKIGLSAFENTYQLILNGNDKVYQTLWSETINAISKKQIPIVHWETSSSVIFKDEPLKFKLRTQIDKPKSLSEQNDLIPLINDLNNSHLWKGKTYPKTTGWQKLSLAQDTTQVFRYYVTDTTKWKSLKSYNTTKANKRQFSTAKAVTNKQFTTRQPLSLVWFYLVFILSIGYLWLEPKL
ncbi:MAG: hypothetical protein KDC81_10555 [Flavobacteriaceae bacterium]|nr:hypothetical protein [Flavobacteriaceae bacterium]